MHIIDLYYQNKWKIINWHFLYLLDIVPIFYYDEILKKKNLRIILIYKGDTDMGKCASVDTNV